jgi:YaaC-like Protein
VLRQLPEVAEDVRRAGWGPAYVVSAKNYHYTFNNDTPESSGKVDLTLCHQHVPEIKAMLVARQNVKLRRFALIVDEMDVMRYEQVFSQRDEIRVPFMRSDIFGTPWIDFRPGRSVHSETLLYLLGLFILSDVVRYQPDQWKRLLDDHPAEMILIDRFLDIGVRKVPNLFLNQFHSDMFLFQVAR